MFDDCEQYREITAVQNQQKPKDTHKGVVLKNRLIKKNSVKMLLIQKKNSDIFNK